VQGGTSPKQADREVNRLVGKMVVVGEPLDRLGRVGAFPELLYHFLQQRMSEHLAPVSIGTYTLCQHRPVVGVWGKGDTAHYTVPKGEFRAVSVQRGFGRNLTVCPLCALDVVAYRCNAATAAHSMRSADGCACGRGVSSWATTAHMQDEVFFERSAEHYAGFRSPFCGGFFLSSGPSSRTRHL
jgi:hypothetical protein